MDASEYKHVILGLIFLKYISDKFDARNEDSVKEGLGLENDPDEHTRMGVLYVPVSARWKEICNHLDDVHYLRKSRTIG